MVTWGVTEPTAGAVGTASTYVLGATDWCDSAPVSALVDGDERRAEGSKAADALTGAAAELVVPASAARLGTTFGVGERRSLDAAPHRLVATHRADDRSVVATVAFEGAATAVRRDDHVELSFPEQTPVTIAVDKRDADGDPVTVPPTPSGLAAAITAMSGAHSTDGPGRSHPSNRRRPPTVELGSTVDVPASVSPDTTGVEVVTPPSFEALFVLAPLSYYLGAEVSVGDVTRPRLRAPAAGVDRRLPALPELQTRCASLLRRCFYLDCHCRDEDGSDAVLASLGLDGAALRDASTAERLARYLDVPSRAISGRLPEWHLSTYVKPDAEHVPALPCLLDDMSQIYLPSASELDDEELLDRTLSDAYRAAADVPSVDVVDPELRDGQIHAWLADGTPIDAYKTTASAYRNRRRYGERTGGPLSVTVVLNDGSMRAERDTVADIYRDQTADRPIDVTVREDLTVGQLARELATPTDFLHYIGHCENGGLRCPDGTLSTAELARSRTRTFFLNACGSYHEGIDLVEAGSMAGAVTLTAVLDEQAATVGTTFARLLTHGFSIERGMQIARRQVLMGKDYAVVGDGTSSLVPVPEEEAVVHLTDRGGEYEVRYEVLTTDGKGQRYDCPFDGTPRLCGDPTERTVSAATLRRAFDGRTLPVIYDGELHWSDDLAPRL